VPFPLLCFLPAKAIRSVLLHLEDYYESSIFVIKVVLSMKGNNSIISVCILQHLVIDDFMAGGDIMGTQAIVCNFNIKNILEFLYFCKPV